MQEVEGGKREETVNVNVNGEEGFGIGDCGLGIWGKAKCEKRKKLERTASKGIFGGLILDGGVGRERGAGIGRLGPVGAR